MKTALLSLAFAGISSFSLVADPYQWVDSDQDLRVLSPGGMISDVLDIRFSDADNHVEKAGFEPGTDLLSLITVGFKFSGMPGAVDVTAGPNWSVFSTGVPKIWNGAVNGALIEFSLTGPVTDGFIDYSLKYISGQSPVTLTKAWLTATGEDNIYVEPPGLSIASVPDGGSSFMLLGSAALGLALLGRRKVA